MAYRLKLTQRAQTDAYSTFEWLAEQSRAAAARWIQGLFKKIGTLRTNAERFPLAEESSEFPYKIHEMLVGKR